MANKVKIFKLGGQAVYGLGLILIIIGGCCLDSTDLHIPVALILLGAGTCLIKYIKLHRCNRKERTCIKYCSVRNQIVSGSLLIPTKLD